MVRVLLNRRAFIDNALCEAGSIVDIGDQPLADYMTLVDDKPPPAVEAPPAPVTEAVVTVRVHEASHSLDIEVGGAATHIDHATLKVEQD